jgi:cysteine synthase A
MYTSEEAEGKRLKHPFDTITEGVGINRLTANFAKAKVDGAFKATDKESVEMAQYLMRNEGLFVGSSAAVNCVGAVKIARKLGPGHVIVTILCDGGHRHLSKFHNKEYLEQHGLTPTCTGKDLDFILLDD